MKQHSHRGNDPVEINGRPQAPDLWQTVNRGLTTELGFQSLTPDHLETTTNSDITSRATSEFQCVNQYWFNTAEFIAPGPCGNAVCVIMRFINEQNRRYKTARMPLREILSHPRKLHPLQNPTTSTIYLLAGKVRKLLCRFCTSTRSWWTSVK